MQQAVSKKQWVAEGVAILYLLLWIYAAASKLLDYETFRVQLGQSPMLTPIAGLVAWVIPALEILLAGLLFFDRTRTFGLYGSFTLMGMFCAYIVAITRYSETVPCSCGGVLAKMDWNQHLVFNILFLLLAASAVLINR